MTELILSLLIGVPLLNLVLYIIRFEATEVKDWRYLASRNYQDKRFWKITPATKHTNTIYEKTPGFDKVRPTLADFYTYIKTDEWSGTKFCAWAWPPTSILVLIWQVLRVTFGPLCYGAGWACEKVGKIRI